MHLLFYIEDEFKFSMLKKQTGYMDKLKQKCSKPIKEVGNVGNDSLVENVLNEKPKTIHYMTGFYSLKSYLYGTYLATQ